MKEFPQVQRRGDELMILNPPRHRSLALAVGWAVAGATSLGCDRSDIGNGAAAPFSTGPGVAALPADAETSPVSVTSPNGEVEFLVAGGSAAGPSTPSLKYRVSYRGKPVLIDSG